MKLHDTLDTKLYPLRYEILDILKEALRWEEVSDRLKVYGATFLLNHHQSAKEYLNLDNPDDAFYMLVNGFDCTDHTFYKVGLHEYTRRYGKDLVNLLFDVNLDGLLKIDNPENNAIVGYYFKGNLEKGIKRYVHWGICTRVDDEVIIESKWGERGSLFIHPFAMVPPLYGDSVHYFRKVERN